jgi:hypothetical protein
MVCNIIINPLRPPPPHKSLGLGPRRAESRGDGQAERDRAGPGRAGPGRAGGATIRGLIFFLGGGRGAIDNINMSLNERMINFTNVFFLSKVKW